MQPCACRDCMEITAGEAGSLCWECEEAGCEPCPGRFEMALGDPFKCQRSDAYSGSGTDDPEDARWEAEYIQPHPRVWPNYIDNPQRCACTHGDDCPEHGTDSAAHHDPSDHVWE